ncbi:MAG: hypothetical protein AAF593_00550 [Planctomycetota bacterium]
MNTTQERKIDRRVHRYKIEPAGRGVDLQFVEYTANDKQVYMGNIRESGGWWFVCIGVDAEEAELGVAAPISTFGFVQDIELWHRSKKIFGRDAVDAVGVRTRQTGEKIWRECFPDLPLPLKATGGGE